MAVSKEDLLKSAFGVEEFEVEGKGAVEIRALTRSEALGLQGREMDALILERVLLATAMLSPKLTEDEVKEWQDTSPAGEMHPLVERVIKISGMEEKAGKAAYADFPGEPDSGV